MANNINENKTTGASDDKIKSMLLEFAEATSNATSNAKAVLEGKGLADALKESIMEDEMDDADGGDEFEGLDAVEVDDEGVEMDNEPIEGDGEDLDMGDEPQMDDNPLDGLDGDTELEIELDMDSENPYDNIQPVNGVYDFSHVTDPEEVARILKYAPEGSEAVTVKKSSFDMSVRSNEDADSGMDMQDNDTEIEDMDDIEADGLDDTGIDMEDAPEMEEETEEEVVESKVRMDERVQTLLRLQNKKIELYEAKIAKMQKEQSRMVNENKKFRADVEKYKSTLNESKKYLDKLALTNKNLANAARLFTENATTKEEKKLVIERFDAVQTLRESDMVFEFFNEKFNGKTLTTRPSKQTIVEAKKTTPAPQKKEAKKINESSSMFDKIVKFQY